MEMHRGPLPQVLLEWQERRKLQDKAVSTLRADKVVERFCEALRIQAVSEITKDAWLRFRHDRIAAGAATGTMNGLHQKLALFLDFCVEEGYTDTNPVRETKVLGKKLARPRTALTLDDARKLIRGPDKLANRLWTGYLLTGMRRDELTGLTRDNIDLDEGIINLRPEETKTRTERYCILGEGLRASIQSRPFDRWVYPNRSGNRYLSNLNRQLRRYCRKLGIRTHMTVHSLRRTMATILLMDLHVHITVVKMLLGHGSIRSGALAETTYCVCRGREPAMVEAQAKLEAALL